MYVRHCPRGLCRLVMLGYGAQCALVGASGGRRASGPTLAPDLERVCPAQGLLEGDVPAAPPAPLAGVSEAALRGAELREGAPLEPGARLPCTVSFTRGQERAVALTVAGLPPARPPPVPGPLLGGVGSGKAAPRMTPGPSRGGWQWECDALACMVPVHNCL